MLRNPETANSRPMINTAIQPGRERICTSEIRAAEISSLSAMGSSSVPMVVTCFQRRARYPSSKSVNAATRKIPSDNQSLVTLTPPTWNQPVSCTSAATSSGTKKIRRMVSAFGRFIAQTNYIKSVTDGYGLCSAVLYLYFAHETLAPPFFPRQSRTARTRRQEAAGMHAMKGEGADDVEMLQDERPHIARLAHTMGIGSQHDRL